jgi:hypothetical protein
MGWLDDLAGAIGHTTQSLADDIGCGIHVLEGVVGELSGYGMDALSVAGKLGMTPVSFLKAVVNVLSGDPHAQLLRYTQVPGLWVKGSSDPMITHWGTMVTQHSDIKQQIDTEFTQVFQDGGQFAYSGLAADALLTTHLTYQSHFTTLIDHAQTQQSRYTTLSSHMETFLSNVHGTVYNLPAPVAATGVVALDVASDTDPAITFMLGLIGMDVTGMAVALPIPGADVPIEVILAIILIVLVVILLLVLLFVAVKDAIETHNREQQTTTTKPTPEPDPTPNPWPWGPDPIPPWLPKNDPDCLKDIAQVKAAFPNVRADLIAYLACLQPKMSPQEVIDLFTRWTNMDMTRQDINDFLARVEENLRLDPGHNQPTRDQIIAFLRNHNQDIPDIWSKYKQVQNIPGIDSILRDMITAPLNKNATPNPTYRGSYFQLNWVVSHQTMGGGIMRVEQYVGGQKGADVVLQNGTYIDVKSYTWKDQTPFFRQIHTIPGLRTQLEKYRTKVPFAGHQIVYVFDSAGGKIPADIQKVFDDEKALGLNVSVQYWPDSNPPQIVP